MDLLLLAVQLRYLSLLITYSGFYGILFRACISYWIGFWPVQSQVIKFTWLSKFAIIFFLACVVNDFQLGTLGAGNHYAEIQVVEEIFNEFNARKMGIEEKGQVCIMIHCGSRGLGHQVATGSTRFSTFKNVFVKLDGPWGLWLYVTFCRNILVSLLYGRCELG